MSTNAAPADPVAASRLFKLVQFVPYTTVSMIAVLVGIGVAGSETYRTKIQSDYISLVVFLTTHSTTVFLVIGAAIAISIVAIIGFYVYKSVKKQAEAKKRVQHLMTIQRSQLMRLYRSTGGDHWRDRTRWGSNESIDRWKGVHINHQSGHVVKIILPENNLVGT